MALTIRVDNRATRRYFRDLDAACRDIDRLRLVLHNRQPYTEGIETGRTRTGRLARKAGGARMMRRGLADTNRAIPRLVMAMLERGSGAGKATTDAIRRTLLGHVQRYTPVRTGRLRDSFVVRGAR